MTVLGLNNASNTSVDWPDSPDPLRDINGECPPVLWTCCRHWPSIVWLEVDCHWNNSKSLTSLTSTDLLFLQCKVFVWLIQFFCLPVCLQDCSKSGGWILRNAGLLVREQSIRFWRWSRTVGVMFYVSLLIFAPMTRAESAEVLEQYWYRFA